MNNWKWPFLQFRWSVILLVLYIIIQSTFLFLENELYIFLILMSIIPTIVYISIVRRSDVGKMEPRGAVSFGILMGIISIYPTIVLERGGIRMLAALGIATTNEISVNTVIYNLLFSFGIIGVIEETIKLIFFFITHYITQENDQPTDAIVYSVAVAGGFAVFENYRYVIAASTYSFSHGFTVALLRTLTAIPVHLGLGLLMGYYLSQHFYPDKFDLTKVEGRKNLLLGLLIPILVHGIYDFFVFTLYLYYAYLDVVFAILFAILLSLWAWKRTIHLREHRKGREN